MSPSNQKILEKIFKVVFDLETTEHVVEVRRAIHPKWDSLAHVSLIAALESEFEINLDISDAHALSSFAAAEMLLSEKGL